MQAVPRVVAFREGMLEIARNGDFGAIITAMLAAEWMDRTWCSSLVDATISDPMLRDWVDMHAAPGFAAQTAWLRDRLDALGEEMTGAERDEAVRLFGRIQQLEIAFHTSACAESSISAA